MTLFRHELRQGRTAFFLWTGSIAALIAVCVCLFPEMEGQLEAAGALFASMGRFTAAFGMDRLSMGTLSGFYCVECGTVLALGGAFYASLLGGTALSREERGRTAEFLLTHPLSRAGAAAQKLAAALTQLAAMDLAVLGAALAALRLTGQAVPWRELALLHGACALLQTELACVCFGLSAFLRRGGAGLSMGLAGGMYALDLLANMTDRAAFLKYVTPFGYCGGADIASAGALAGGPVAAGMALACLGAAAAFLRYGTKDIR